MNRCLLIFLLLCHYIVMQAQQYQYVPMPLGDGQWRYRFTTETGYMSYPVINVTVSDYVLYGNGQDTIINGKTYKKILERRHMESGHKPFNFPLQHVVADNPEYIRLCVREDNKRVYFYTDYHDTLLYNFEAVVGDTIPRHYIHLTDVDKYKVYEVDTVNIGGILRKRFRASELYYNADTMTVIEGIGREDGGLMMPSRRGNIGYYTHYPMFCCFTAPGITYPDTSSSCYLVWPYGTPTSVNDAIDKEATRIYPNPFTEAIHIDGIAEGMAVLYNSAGIKVSGQVLREGKNTISTPAMGSGMYMLVLKDKTGQITGTRKLVK